MNENKIVVFQKKEIRKTIHENEWWFVIEDVVFALTDSKDPKQYIQRIKLRDIELKKGWVQIVHTLLIETSSIKQKDIVQIGLRNECEALQSVKNLPMNGSKEEQEIRFFLTFKILLKRLAQVAIKHFNHLLVLTYIKAILQTELIMIRFGKIKVSQQQQEIKSRMIKILKN